MTSQVPDILTFDERHYDLLTPVGLPKRHWRILERADADVHGACGSTACARGYLARWFVDNGLLYLHQLSGRWRLLPDYPLFANWVSGSLMGMDQHGPANTSFRENITQTETVVCIELTEGRVTTSNVTTTVRNKGEIEGVWVLK